MALLVSGFGLFPAGAGAASESFNQTFEVDYYIEATSTESVNLFMRADGSVALGQFDTMGGTRILDSVTLDMGVGVNALVRVDRTDGGNAAVSDAALIENLYVRGAAPSINDPSLVVQADFPDFAYDAPANTNMFSVVLDEADFVSNSTTDALDFVPFIGNSKVIVEIRSTFRFKLIDGFTTDGIEAALEGGARVTYDYHLQGEDPPPPGGVIPTPAAAGLGLAMLAALVGRRRR